jgi:hypothetical protein
MIQARVIYEKIGYPDYLDGDNMTKLEEDYAEVRNRKASVPRSRSPRRILSDPWTIRQLPTVGILSDPIIGNRRYPTLSGDFRQSDPTTSDTRNRQLPTPGNPSDPVGSTHFRKSDPAGSTIFRQPKKSVTDPDKLPVFPLCANHYTKIKFT